MPKGMGYGMKKEKAIMAPKGMASKPSKAIMAIGKASKAVTLPAKPKKMKPRMM